jgi:pimeloyl-ACP methyl ester carboxylesterase
MARRVLLVGTSSLLAGHLAAHRLMAPDAPEVALVVAARARPGVPRPDAARLASFAADRARDLSETEGAGRSTTVRDPCGAPHGDRLSVRCADPDTPGFPDLPPADEVWCVLPGWDPAPTRGVRHDGALARALLSALPRLGARRYVHVGPVGPVGTDAGTDPGRPAWDTYRDLERRTARTCRELGISWRVLRCPTVVDAAAPLLGESPPGLHELFAAVRSVRAEVTDRVTDWFEQYPLRVETPRHLGMPLLPAGHAAAELCRAAGTPEPTGGTVTVASPAPVPLEELLPRVGAALGIDLRPARDRAEFSAADQLLELRLHRVRRSFVPLAATGVGEADRPPTGPRPAPPAHREPLSAGAQWELLGRLRAHQDLAETPSDDSTAVLSRTLLLGGAPLTVDERGDADGPPLVLVNALGQGPGFLTRLAQRLARHHRVVTWRVRGTEPDGPSWHVERQIEDLAAVLDMSGADQCHLIGWCTGAKIATALQRRMPDAVASLVFLNPTFKQDGLWAGMDTKYERDLEVVCRTLVRNPARAVRLSGLLSPGGTSGSEGPGAPGAGVLGVLSTALTEEVRRPFRDPATLVRYARQLVDLWHLDSVGQASSVTAPVLFVSSEYDGVSSPARARAAARLFPRAVSAELAHAGHYAPHDRASLVAELIMEFVAAPETLTESVVHGEVRWHPPTEPRPSPV